MKKVLLVVSVLMIIMSVCACGNSGDSSGDASDTNPIKSDEIQALYTTPSDFKGRTFEFTAVVMSVEKDGDEVYIQAMYDIENYDKNTVIEYENADFSVAEGDYIKVIGTVEGEFEGKNALGGKVSAPLVEASSVEVISDVEAYPAESTYEVNQTVTSGGCEATVTKVDFTSDETRIYITIKNNGSSEISMYPDQGVIIQNGKQYEVNDNFRYEDMQSDIKAGASIQGVVAFDKVEKSGFSFEFSGYNSDYDEMDFKYSIEI